MNMKRFLFCLIAVLAIAVSVQAKKYPQLKFEKTTIDLGEFCMDEPVRKCAFKFTNVGNAKLVINKVRVTCGCTVVDYPKDFIAPGACGVITVTYDGSHSMPGRFKKSVTIEANTKNVLTRIFIQGDMTDVPVSKKVEKNE